MKEIVQALGLCNCFIAGTLVATETGYVAIENIKAGNFVWATDTETGDTELKQVVQAFQNEAKELVHITVNGEEIVCTTTHPFYVPPKGWIEAIHLRAGDRLQLLNGEYVVIEQVQHELLESPIAVYNFEVEDFHTYYVGDTEVLVHNKCSDVDKMSSQEANKIRDDIMSWKDVTFNSKDDAVKFINEKFPSYPQEVAGHRSAQGWHFDRRITTNSIVSGARKDFDVWVKYVDCMLNGYSIRKAAEECGIHRKTAFAWRHKILDALQNMADEVTIDGIVKAD